MTRDTFSEIQNHYLHPQDALLSKPAILCTQIGFFEPFLLSDFAFGMIKQRLIRTFEASLVLFILLYRQKTSEIVEFLV